MMRILLIAASVGGLLLTVVPAMLVFWGAIAFPLHAKLMAVGTLAWFASAPLWMKRESAEPSSETPL